MRSPFWSILMFVSFLAGVAMPTGAVEITSTAKQAYITDFLSGKVLFSKNADEPMKPASMAKIMTVFAAFHRIVAGALKMDDEFVVLMHGNNLLEWLLHVQKN